MEREVDFNRDRLMRCPQCGSEWTVDLAWVERWYQADEACPGCGTTSEAENAAQFAVHADDPALNDTVAVQLAWYHTSTYLDWPPTIDFAGRLNDDVRQMMGGDEAVERWANRQDNKALHVGSYESAVHNMLRRINDQGDEGKQFYLHRVYLKPEVVIRPGWIPDSSNFVGDVHLEDLGPPEVEAVRYVNFHEDPGGLSVAIRPSAIAASQCLAIPLPIEDDDSWILDTLAQLSADPPDQPLPPELERFRHLLDESPRARTAEAAVNVLASRLPSNLRRQFEAATRWEAGSDPIEWVHHAAGLARLFERPAAVLAELDAKKVRQH